MIGWATGFQPVRVVVVQIDVFVGVDGVVWNLSRLIAIHARQSPMLKKIQKKIIHKIQKNKK